MSFDMRPEGVPGSLLVMRGGRRRVSSPYYAIQAEKCFGKARLGVALCVRRALYRKYTASERTSQVVLS